METQAGEPGVHVVRGELLPEGDAVLGADGLEQLRLGKDPLLDQKLDHPGAVFPDQPSHLGENVGGDAEGLQTRVETGGRIPRCGSGRHGRRASAALGILS